MARSRRLKLPRAVAARLDLERGERPLAWATDSFGAWYVGTDRAVYLPVSDGFSRLGWERVERAEWHQDTDRLAIVEVADWGEPEGRIEIAVSDPGQLLELLRERVTKSVVTTVYAPVRGRSGLNVVARRSPVGSGPIVWSYVLADGLDPNDPDVVEVAGRTLREAEAELGWLA